MLPDSAFPTRLARKKVAGFNSTLARVLPRFLDACSTIAVDAIEIGGFCAPDGRSFLAQPLPVEWPRILPSGSTARF